MNGWRFRVVLAVVFYVAAKIHQFATESFGNSDGWMLLYHGSAAAVDLSLLHCAPWLIKGRLCDDIQATCIASVLVNALGWALYLAYFPPAIYNSLIMVLSYIQFARLLFMDRHDADTLGRNVFRGLAGGWSKRYSQEAHS